MKKLYLLLVVACISLVANAQSTYYSFNQTTGVTYTPITVAGGATTLIAAQPTVGTNWDDQSTTTTMPFAFNVMGTAFASGATLYLNANGYIEFGGTTSYSYNPASVATAGRFTIGAEAQDMQGNGTDGIICQTQGTAPNRTFTINWTNTRHYNTTGNWNFQIVLYETSNIIEFQYGSHTGFYTTLAGYCGIWGTSGTANNWVGRSVTSGTAWTSSAASTSRAAGNAAAMVSHATTLPVNGMVWTFCPAAARPTLTTSSSPACTPATLTVSGASTYTWAPNTSLTSTTGTSTIATPAATTIYTVTGVGTNRCSSNATITVNPTPSAISGNTEVCTSKQMTLSSATTGGTWSSSATGVATVNSTTGVVGGASAGTATITYTKTGCYVVYPITVNATPSLSVSSSNVYCTNSSGTTITASGTGATYAWSPSGSLNVATGATVVANPSGNQTYTVVATSAVGSCTIQATNTLVYHTAATMLDTTLGGGYVCLPGTTPYFAVATLTPSTVYATYGTYSTTDPSVATVDPVYGMVYGVGAGTTTVTYTDASCGYSVTQDVRVYNGGFNVSVSPTSATYCASGGPVTLTASADAGTPDIWLWTKSDLTTATGLSSTNTAVTTASPSTTTSYIISATQSSSGCHAQASITVTNATVAAITGGSTNICNGIVTTMSDATSSGTWSSSDNTIASVNSTTGAITGGTVSGVATISYTVGSTGCYSTRDVTVNQYPSATVSPTSACTPATLTAGSAATYSWAPTTGLSATNTASVTATGTAPTTYTVTLGNSSVCTVTATATVTPTPQPITGTQTICSPQAVTLLAQNCSALAGQVGGTWTIVNNGTYSAAGAYNFTLRTTTYPDTYNPSAWTGGFLAGSGNLAGNTLMRTQFMSPAFSTIGMSSASVSFNHYYPVFYSGDSARVEYSLNGTTWNDVGGFTAAAGNADLTNSASLASFSLPAGALGQPTVYIWIKYKTTYGWDWYVDNIVVKGTQQQTTTFAEAVTGGTWSTSAPSVASVTSGGVVSGVTSGTATISYANTCGTVTRSVTVLGVPGTIGGTMNINVGSSSTLTNSTLYGTWSTASSAIATIDPVTGQAFGVAVGTTGVTYTTGCGSAATAIITVSTPCSGTPTAGTASISPNYGGSTTAFVATLSGYDLSSGISFQWQKSTTSSSSGFTDIAGATNATYSFTGITTNTWYQCVVTCATTSLSASSTVAAASYFPPSSCTPAFYYATSICSNYMVVATTGYPFVVTGATGSISDATACNTTAYRDFTANSPTVTFNQGNNYTATLGANIYAYSMSDQIWIDFNNDGIFTTTERVGGGTFTTTTTNPVISIPGSPSVTTGTVRMRVETEYFYHTYPNLSPCPDGTTTNQYYYGEVRDYRVNIQALPAITASGSATTLCGGSTVTFSNATTGGTWTSSNTARVAINATTGVATGGTESGIDTIYYSASGMTTYYTITNVAVPTAITGSSTVCVSQQVTLTEAVTGGTWSSSSTANATVTSAGVVGGVAGGTVTISYSTGCGTPATFPMTVNSLPGTTTASTTSMCSGATATLTNTVPGGTWSSSDITVASVNSTSGVVTGTGGGTVTITYSMGCATYATTAMSINVAPADINPLTTVDLCVGLTTTLTNSSLGGTWSSSDAAIATVNSTTGVVGGVATGTATITYSNACGAPATRDVNVNTPPNATISGTSPVCQYGSTILSNSVTGGAWYSANTSIATIDAATGELGGVAGGTVTISYITTGCNPVTRSFTITPVPAAIGGTTIACTSSSTTLTNSVAGGTWSSSNTSVASINASTGVVTSTASTGITTISYDNGCAPAATAIFTVSSTPAAIGGTMSLCKPVTPVLLTSRFNGNVTDSITGTNWTLQWLGTASSAFGFNYNAALSPTTFGGITGDGSNWLGANPDGAGSTVTVNTIATSPAFSTIGLSAATLTLNTYMFSSSTWDAASLLEYSTDGGSTWTTLYNYYGATTGSTTWTMGTPNQTLSLPSAMMGIPNAMIRFKYQSSWGFYWAIDNVVIKGTPTTSVATLTDATPGGTWSSGTTSVATIVSGTGVWTSVAPGTSTITYASPCGSTTATVTVNNVPAAISGASTVCQGSSISLTNSVSGGTWSSYNSSIATVSATGVVTGVAGGSTYILYSNGCGATAVKAVTVTALPGTITGATSLCPGGAGTLFNTATGGTWSTSNSAVVTVNATTGYATALGASGTSATITYATGCAPAATLEVSINNTAAITGTTSACASLGAASTILAQNFNSGLTGTTGGTWSIVNTSGNAASLFQLRASPGYTGGVAGDGSQYMQANAGAYGTTTIVTEFRSPAFSTIGMTAGTIAYNQYYSGYSVSDQVKVDYSLNGGTTWTNINTVGGVVTGTTTWSASTPTTSLSIPAGARDQSSVMLRWYLSGVPSGCNWAVDNINVSGVFNPYTVLSDATPGGTWSSSAPAVASITSTGTVFGLTAGTATISYAAACGTVTTNFTVNPAPGAITGASYLCAGSSTTMGNSLSGGTWSVSDAAIATINASTGVVTGLSAGTCQISYSTTCGSPTPYTLTVRALPTAITGSTDLCPSSVGTLYNTASGGTWSISSTTSASVNASTGVITSTATTGTATVTYSNGCGTDQYATINVSNATAPIAGTTSACTQVAVTSLLAQNWETPAGSAVPTSTTAVNGWSQLTTPTVNYLYTYTSGTSPAASPQSGTYFLASYCYGFYGNQTVVSPSFSLSGTNGATMTYWVYRDATSTYNNSTYGAEGFTVSINTTNSLTGATTLGFVPRAAAVATTGSYISGTSTTATAGWYQYRVTTPASYTGGTNYLLITANRGSSTNSFTYAYLDNISLTVNPFTATLTDATPGGTWSSSNSAIASVNVTSGVVSAISTGTATITYTSACGTPVTTTFTVNGNPAAIGGAGAVCIGNSLTLTNTATNGTWSISNPTVATIDATTGVVTGLTAGTAVATYSNGCGTATTATITVRSAPAAITGATSMCPSTTTNLTNSVAGGTWSSSDPSVATIGTFSGTVYATATPGTTTITYSNTCSPDVTSVITVSSSTDTIVGVSSICAQPTPLVSTSFESGVPSTQGIAVDGWNYLQGTGSANNYWSSIAGTSTASPATSGTPSGGGTFVAKFGSNAITSGNSAYLVSPSFDLSGANGGRVTMYFYRDNSLTSTYDSLAMYINTSASASGATRIGSVCRSRTLTTAYVGTAVAAGWQKLTFTIPATFTGSTNYILLKGYSAAGNNMYVDSVQIRNNSGSATFTDATSGGTWSTSNASVATITTGGVVSAVSAGTATISYTGACGAPVTKDLTVNPVPGSNTSGATTLCVGATTTVANALAGGTWYSSAPTIATVDVSGTVTALSVGRATISYFNGCGAAATTAVTVNAVPTIASVTASAPTFCAGSVLTLTAGAVTGTGTLTSYNWSGPAAYSAAGTATTDAHIVASASATGEYSVTVTYPGLGCTSNPATVTATVYDYPVAQNVTGGNGCSASGITVGLDGSQSGITYALVLAPSTTAQTLTGTGSSFAFTSVNTAGAYIVTGTTGPGCTTTMTGADTIRLTPTITPGVMSSICEGITSQSITYTPATGSPTTYSIDWSSAANTAGFTDITDAPLGGTMGYTIPGSGAIGLFTGTITVSNGYCTSAGYSTNITVYSTPTMTMTDTIVPCYGYTGSIEFSGPDSTTVNYRVNGGALNHFTFSGTTYSLSTGVLTAPVTYQIVSASNPVCATTYNDTVTITPTPMMWVGGTPGFETDWNTASNWSCGFVPAATDSVTIPGTLYAPEMPAAVSATVSDLDVASGTVINLNAGSSLHVAGNVHSFGTIAGNGRVILSGASAQKIYGIGTFSNVELDNTNGATIQPGARMMISKAVYLTAGTLTTNDSLELLSTDTSAAARIASIPSGAGISGKVKTDQYVQGGYRRFRFWGHSFSDSISLSQLTPYIDITGTGGSANGFTTTTTNNPSAFRYDPYMGDDAMSADPGWRPFTKINSSAADTNLLHPGQGIRLFFRGSKGEGLGYLGYLGMYTPSSTINKMNGHVNQGPVSIYLKQGSVVPARQSYNQISNPYPSPVDIGTVLYNAKAAGQVTGSAFYVWNPALGAGGQYMAIPIGSTSAQPYYLQANTSFQVKADHDGAHVDFVESDKVANASLNLFRAPANAVRFNIYDTTYHLWDVLSMQFNDKASDNEDKQLDATKPYGPDLNFYSISKDGSKLAIDARPYEGDKVVPLGVKSAYQQDFVIRAESISVPTGGAVTLHDKLLNKYVDMKEGTEYRFTIGKDKSTQGDERFELVLKPTTAAAVKGLEVSMAPNPASDDVKITFTSGSKDNVSVRIMDVSGVSIYSQDLGTKQNGVITVPMSNFAAGVYMVEITQGDNKVTKRLVKE